VTTPSSDCLSLFITRRSETEKNVPVFRELGGGFLGAVDGKIKDARRCVLVGVAEEGDL
jgi:hypothetical protein